MVWMAAVKENPLTMWNEVFSCKGCHKNTNQCKAPTIYEMSRNIQTGLFKQSITDYLFIMKTVTLETCGMVWKFFKNVVNYQIDI